MDNTTMHGLDSELSQLDQTEEKAAETHYLGGDENDGSYMPSFGHEGISAASAPEQSRYEFEEDVVDDLIDHDGWAHINIGKSAYQQRDYATAQVSFEEGLGLFRQMEDSQGISIANYHIGKAIYRQGDYPGARTYFEQALEHCRDSANSGCLASTLWYLGKVSYREGNLEEAMHDLSEALEYSREIGDPNRIAWALNYLGKVSYRLKDYSTSRTKFKEALPLFRELADQDAIATCLLNLAQTELALGRLADAHLWAIDSRNIYAELGDKAGVKDCTLVIDRAGQPMPANADSFRTENVKSIQYENQAFAQAPLQNYEMHPQFEEISNPEKFDPESAAFNYSDSEAVN